MQCAVRATCPIYGTGKVIEAVDEVRGLRVFNRPGGELCAGSDRRVACCTNVAARLGWASGVDSRLGCALPPLATIGVRRSASPNLLDPRDSLSYRSARHHARAPVACALTRPDRSSGGWTSPLARDEIVFHSRAIAPAGGAGLATEPAGCGSPRPGKPQPPPARDAASRSQPRRRTEPPSGQPRRESNAGRAATGRSGRCRRGTFL